MLMYECNRCGQQFGSPAAVRMHLRLKHFNKTLCCHCGDEIKSKIMNSHLKEDHKCKDHVPLIYAPPPTNKRVKLKKESGGDNENKSHWDVVEERLEQFVAPGTLLTCRICGKKLGDVHGREQHEREIHRFTEQTKRSLAFRLEPWNMLDHLSPKDTRTYINTDLKSKFCDSPECNGQVNTLVNFLISELPFQVSHVIRGGSYGKQTCLKEHSDLDIVLFIEDYPLFGGTPASIKRLRSCLEQIKRILQNSLLSTRILISETTPRSLRFQYQCFNNNHVHHVDLMPCNDLLGASPSTEDKKSLYELMAGCRSQHEMQLFNLSLLQLQVEFVRNQPRIVHDLIRVVKHWKKSSLGKMSSLNKFRRLPNSYTFESITIHVWQSLGKPVKFEIRQGLAAVLRQLVCYPAMKIVWCDNYPAHNKHLIKTLSGIKPIVVDPANPLHNLCDDSNCWDEIAYVAKESLKRPLFQNFHTSKLSINQ